jgi:hypothetical protein
VEIVVILLIVVTIAKVEVELLDRSSCCSISSNDSFCILEISFLYYMQVFDSETHTLCTQFDNCSPVCPSHPNPCLGIRGGLPSGSSVQGV